MANEPGTIINSIAPIRICDNGGWTDTWFAGNGRVFNIGISPYAEVQISFLDTRDTDNQIIINAVNYQDRYAFDTEKYSSRNGWDRHPLIEASIEYMQFPKNLALEITIYSDAPAGASTGTSAAITVALIGALDVLTSGRMTPIEVAMAAQKVETELLGQQCGIQDQLCSAHGGINYIKMNQYPFATVSPIYIPDDIWWELDRRLILFYLGKSHSSSDVHKMVIETLENEGPKSNKLSMLRKTAPRSRNALCAGDFTGFGDAMIDNHEAQRMLHPALISEHAERIVKIAKEYGAIGWKVNGAGGEGGSLTILCGARFDEKQAMIRAVEEENALFQYIPTKLSRSGLQVWINQRLG